ncbi:MAG: MlaE family ABC transporter permease [Chitinophagales bacterium]
MLKTLNHIGRYTQMLMGMFSAPENAAMYWKETVRQMVNIGVGSLIIISVISMFMGAVTAVQFAFQLQGSPMVPIYLLGYIIRDMMIIELAPTISCLVLAGKVGSNIAGELGTMRVSEQIDALEIMGINTTSYLIAPKILAGVLIVPLLIILASFLGIFGGMMSADSYGIDAEIFQRGIVYLFEPFNVVIMLIKATVFAFIVTSVSCYQGYYVKGGALDIGKASTRAVVYSSILIIFFDYILASILT